MGVIETIVNTVVRAHRPVLLLSLGFALLSIGLLVEPGLREDYTIASLIAADDEDYHRFRRFSREFVSGEMALFAVDAGDPLEPNNLELLHGICESCRELEGIESPLAISELPQIGLGALFTPGGELETIYSRLQNDPGARDKIEEDLQSNPLVVGNLIGTDPNTGRLNTTAGVIVQIKAETEGPRRKWVADQLRRILADSKSRRPDATIMLGGPLVGLIEIFEAIRRDMAVFTVVVLVLICVALSLIFRRVVPLLVALTAAGLSVLCVLGLSVASALPMSLVSQTVVILVIVLAVSMCVHLLVAHDETRLRRDAAARGPLHDARVTLQRMLLPCATVAATTSLGFASLFISTLKPAKQLAGLVIVGMALSLLLGLSAIPALARLAARRQPADHGVGRLRKGLRWVGTVTGEGKTWPVVGVVVFAVLIGFCMIKVPAALSNFESDFVKNFREDSNVRRVYKFVSENLMPVGNIEVVVRRADGGPVLGETTMQAIESARVSWASPEGDEDPAWTERQLLAQIQRQLSLHLAESRAGMDLMQAVDEFTRGVSEDLDPPIRKSLSLLDLVKLASIGRLLGLTSLELPRFEWQFALTMVMIDQKLSQEMLRNFMTSDGQALRINLRALESDDVYRKLDIARRVSERARQTFGPDYDVEVTGLYPLYAKIAAGLLRDQLRTFFLALVLITVCMCVALRSLGLGLLSMVPNLMPMIFCLGVMGWAEIPINMATAMMLSAALGIAVDNTVHYLWRFRRELRAERDYAAAIVNTHQTVGRACVFNGVVIIGGFWVLCLSEFIPTAYFGMMIGLTMVGALVGDLILLPMLLTLVKPIRTE